MSTRPVTSGNAYPLDRHSGNTACSTEPLACTATTGGTLVPATQGEADQIVITKLNSSIFQDGGN